MKQPQTITLAIGAFIVGLGVLLLAGVAGLVENATVYIWALPFIFILSGFALLQGTPKIQNSISYGLIATGLIVLLVRFGWINGALVNALLAGALIATGSMLIVHRLDNRSKTVRDDKKI